MIDFDAYRAHVISVGCPDCRGRGSSDLCPPHLTKNRQFEQLQLSISSLARKAVDFGMVEAQRTCNRCGQEKQLVAHHADYNLPFEIEWLCHKCHSIHHAPERRKATIAKREHKAQLAAQAEAAA